MKIDSLIVKGLPAHENPDQAIVPPVYLASTYVQKSLTEHQTYAYARGGNPTRNNLEALFAKIEGSKHSFAFSSGMAATAAAFHLFKQGDKILLNNNVYGGTFRYVDQLFAQNGLEYELIDDFNQLTVDDLADNVAGIFIETPSNPLLRVTDIARVAQIAHQKGILLIVDNTFLTPYFQKPLDLGADIVVYSATKYIGGHGDIIAGLVTVNDDKIAERLKFIQNTLGAILNPNDAYGLIRGVKTLSVRLDRQEENVKKLIAFLAEHPGIKTLHYPGSYSKEEADIQGNQAQGLGAVIALELAETYDQDKFVTALDFFDLAVSLGGVESLICHPASMTHESYAPELQAKIGITDRLLRLAVGIENSEDLLQDLKTALYIAKTNE